MQLGSPNNSLTISNEFHMIGETCLDLLYKAESTRYPFFGFKYYYPPEYAGKTITVTAYAFKTHNVNSSLILSSANENIKSVAINSQTFQKVSCTSVIPENNDLLEIRFVIWSNQSSDVHLYVDNITASIQ